MADRSLPWWWAGLSIAATTFAADTPLAVTGIVASRGIEGNWIWLSWVGVHAAVVVYFAVRWHRADVITDAEFVALRYEGRAARWLRAMRSVLFGLVYNCIILGWVLRAMIKIASPFFDWQSWTPGLVEVVGLVVSAQSPIGSPSEVLTVMVLLAVVAVYSSLGGIRGVVFTDLVQLGFSLVGSFWFAYVAWERVGGGSALRRKLTDLYGAEHKTLQLFPSPGDGWGVGLEVGAFVFGMYLLVQSYANVPSDGGGYLMQRLGATRSEQDARRAALLFVLLQYVVRLFPWLVVAVSALVLIPVGGEGAVFDGVARDVAADRELAYPVLMVSLLPPVVLGLMVTSLLAAFMSTVDTHINWGASYLVNDIFCPLFPGASKATELRVARLAVVAFVVLAVVVSLHIDTIEQAWKWVAALGAALGVPTALRWLWWRMNAASEIGAMIVGLGCAAYLQFATDLPYELRLLITSAASVLGLLVGIAAFPAESPATIRRFVERIQPLGSWPGQPKSGMRGVRTLLCWCGLVAAVVLLIKGGHAYWFEGATLHALAFGGVGIVALVLSYRSIP